MSCWNRRITALLAVLLICTLSACGQSQIPLDYGDETAFEADLNAGKNLVGKTVSFVAAELHPQSLYGYDIWAGEHLNFISSKNPDIEVGQTVTVKVTAVESVIGSWFIEYEKVDAAADENTIYASDVEDSDNADETEAPQPLEIADYGWYADPPHSGADTMCLHYCGMMHNPNETLVASYPKITVTISNPDGTVIATDSQTGGTIMPGDIIAWNDTIVDGHNRYEICNKMRIPYGVKELDFPSRDAAIAWICANQLGRRNISEETRKYLIGKQYEAEKKVQRNRNGYNQYRPNPNITVGRGRPIDEESGRRTAARLGRKYHVSGATVQKYAKYSAALDTIEQNAPELVPHILSGAYKISFENIVALSEMEPEELKALSKKIGKNPYAFARYSESRRCLYSDASAKPGTAAAEQPAIKTMPAYDPDAEVAGLTLTIPSWMSSIDRTKSMAHLEAISPAARQNLLAALTELEGKIQEMLNAIEVES